MPEDQATDAELIKRSLAEPAVFTALFDRHYLNLHRYLAARWGVEAGADLAAETFTRAFEQRHRFDTSNASARPWLFGIALNLTRMEARRLAREARALARSFELDVIDEFEASAVARIDAMQKAFDTGLATALEDLKSRDRDVLLLAVLGEMTHTEIAGALDLRVGTVKSSLYRTLKFLQGILERERRS